MKSTKKGVKLSILEAYTRDVGRGIARIDNDVMELLNTQSGDAVQFSGIRKSVAKCLPLLPSDEGKGIMRIDALKRNDVGLKIGDTVIISKTTIVAAEKISVAPLESIPPIDERYLADALDSVACIEGDSVMVPYFGGRLVFKIQKTVPKQPVMITQKTLFTILDRPKSEEEQSIEEVIEKIENRIKIQEKKLITLIDKKTIDSTEINTIFNEINNLNNVVTYFKKKIK